MEELKIYKEYLELIYYTENILKKYPKSERFSLVNHIKNNTYDGLKYIILSYKDYSKKNKYFYLNKLDVNLRMLCVLIRISKRNRRAKSQ